MNQTKRLNQLFSIGEVIASLSEQFPDLTISKIRFLESAGLVTPLRSQSGYRKFSHFEINRIRYILQLQLDYYLPLKVIREHLNAVDAGIDDPIPVKNTNSLRSRIIESENSLSPSKNSLNMTLEELITAADKDQDLIGELIDMGFVVARGGKYNIADLELITIVAQLQELGVPLKHLRSVKNAVDRDIALADAVTKPFKQKRTIRGQQLGIAQEYEILTNLGQLHATLLKNAASRDLSK